MINTTGLTLILRHFSLVYKHMQQTTSQQKAYQLADRDLLMGEDHYVLRVRDLALEDKPRGKTRKIRPFVTQYG